MERWLENNMRWVLLTPAVLVLLGLTVFPTIYMFTVSFQKFNPADPSANEFIGFANFARLLSDDKFHNALQNTLLFTSVAVAAEFAIGLSFALLADKYIRRLNFIKTVLLIPMMLPPIAVAITWKLLYQPQFGVINDILFRLGFEPVLWTASVNTAMLSIILVDIWEWTPFIFLMMLAGLAGLPNEPYEAAELDGAGAWQKFRDLTWPFLRPVVTITLLLRIMDAFRLFDQVYILTRGGPAGSTETLSYYIYKVAFRFFDIGYAAAISLFMLFLTVAFSTWFIKRMQPED
jgi:multiple sugar transport system permease protein